MKSMCAWRELWRLARSWIFSTGQQWRRQRSRLGQSRQRAKQTAAGSFLDYEEQKKKQQNARERVAAERVRKEVNREVSAILMEQKREYHAAQEQKKEQLFARVEEKACGIPEKQTLM